MTSGVSRLSIWIGLVPHLCLLFGHVVHLCFHLGDVIFAELACTLNDIIFCLDLEELSYFSINIGVQLNDTICWMSRFIVMVSVIIPSAIIRSIIILSAIIRSIIILCAITLNVVLQRVFTLRTVILSDNISVITLSVITLSVIILSVIIFTFYQLKCRGALSMEYPEWLNIPSLLFLLLTPKISAGTFIFN